jgi:lipid II:glycine glycyltransferase (peptidoglycan interpeptide bridge formation enzyme)
MTLAIQILKRRLNTLNEDLKIHQYEMDKSPNENSKRFINKYSGERDQIQRAVDVLEHSVSYSFADEVYNKQIMTYRGETIEDAYRDGMFEIIHHLNSY